MRTKELWRPDRKSGVSKAGGTRPVVSAKAASRMDLAVRSAFVGRKKELRRLRELLGSVERGQGQVISLEGPVGIGKSRLLGELESLSSGQDLSALHFFSRKDLAYNSSVKVVNEQIK